MQVFNFTDQVINKKYKISHQINKGSFGLLFKAIDLDTGLDLAVKIEPYSLSKKYLIKEARIYNLLQKSLHIPRIHWCGSKPNSTFLVMELLGKNLEDLFKECNRKLSLKTILMLADQMIANLEFIHSKGYLHRDINPRNICVGLGEKASKFYSIDFGLSSTYRELTINDQLKENYPFIGTLNFASVKSHQGLEQTCSDDLESLFYVLIYCLIGKLPWENIANEKIDLRRKIEEIKQEKLNMKLEDLCCELPEELKECLEYIKKLEFYMKPDYKLLRKKCVKLYMKKYGSYDYQYDWSNKEEKEKDLMMFGINETKEKTGLRHHRKLKSRLIKEEQKINNEKRDSSIEENYEEQKVCKKNEDEGNRRKNSFAMIVPDQIYHIKKKVKIDNAVNLIEKSSTKEIISTKEENDEKMKKSETKNEDNNEKKNDKKQEKKEKEKDIDEGKSDDSKSSEGKESPLENEKLKSTIKEKFDLLFGKEEENIGKEKDKAYCKIF